MKTNDRFWLRRHKNEWTSVVHRHPDGQFSAGGVYRWGGVPHDGIADLEFAKAKADADVNKKAPHSCEREKCERWPERRVQTLTLAHQK